MYIQDIHTQMNVVEMQQEHTDEMKWCDFHPNEVVIGVCAFCLNQRLSVLAANKGIYKTCTSTHKKLSKFFALRSLRNRLDTGHNKSQYFDSSISSTSQEDSFISIKFEDNGAASWDTGKIPKTSLDQNSEMPRNHICGNTKKVNSLVEHAKPNSTLRWRKRIGQVIELLRGKRPSKGKVYHAGIKLEVAKVRYRYSWIRSLAKRRTTENERACHERDL